MRPQQRMWKGDHIGGFIREFRFGFAVVRKGLRIGHDGAVDFLEFGDQIREENIHLFSLIGRLCGSIVFWTVWIFAAEDW